eukprot:scpid84503/ scgid1051/ 
MANCLDTRQGGNRLYHVGELILSKRYWKRAIIAREEDSSGYASDDPRKAILDNGSGSTEKTRASLEQKQHWRSVRPVADYLSYCRLTLTVIVEGGKAIRVHEWE